VTAFTASCTAACSPPCQVFTSGACVVTGGGTAGTCAAQ
jgi:hypothetical protein